MRIPRVALHPGESAADGALRAAVEFCDIAEEYKHTELEPLPDGKAYDSLDENDGPLEPSADCLMLDEVEILGLDEHPLRHDPYA